VFHLNTPTMSASKCFVHADCDVAIVFARLLVDTIDKGIHAFLVSIRQEDKSLVDGVRMGTTSNNVVATSRLLPSGWIRFYDMTIPRCE
jgi:alkylation response protein AidB-like acyl-CoA dehydrogenase